MEVKFKFKFKLGQKVKLNDDVTGEVETVSKSLNQEEPRYIVRYFDKNGARFTQWFDESELS